MGKIGINKYFEFQFEVLNADQEVADAFTTVESVALAYYPDADNAGTGTTFEGGLLVVNVRTVGDGLTVPLGFQSNMELLNLLVKKVRELLQCYLCEVSVFSIV